MQENTARKLPVLLPSVPETISRPLFGHSPYHWDMKSFKMTLVSGSHLYLNYLMKRIFPYG